MQFFAQKCGARRGEARAIKLRLSSYTGSEGTAFRHSREGGRTDIGERKVVPRDSRNGSTYKAIDRVLDRAPSLSSWFKGQSRRKGDLG